MEQVISRAASLIQGGHIIVYPTETFFAVGGDALNPEVIEYVCKLKKRPAHKPFPLLVGHPDMLQGVVRFFPEGFSSLVSSFWPGPLSVLLPGSPGLPSGIIDERGYICVRWSPHPTAVSLSRESDRILIATSANPGQGVPASRAEHLDEHIVKQVSLVVYNGPRPAGGQPSTIVEFSESGLLKIHRHGVVTQKDLSKAGFKLESPS